MMVTQSKGQRIMPVKTKPKANLEKAAAARTMLGVTAAEAASAATFLEAVAADLEAPGDVRQRSASLVAELTNAPTQKRREESMNRVLALVSENV
jgi:hypothetical protein